MASKTGKSVEEILTEKFIEMMSHGIIPWNKPWFGTECGVYNLLAKQDVYYNGINELLCYKDGAYLTRKQMKDVGATFKDEDSKKNGTMVVFFKPLVKQVQDEQTGEIQEQAYKFVLRYTQVWHVSDLNVPQEVLDKHLREKAEPPKPLYEGDHILKAQAILMDYINREHIKFTEENVGAWYCPSTDHINVPPLNMHYDCNEYYSTLAHESVHSTARESRCNRKLESMANSGKSYSFEELIAEMGAASLLHRIGVSTEATEKNSVAYLQGWMKKLGGGDVSLVKAASQAAKAVKYILGIETINS